MKKPINANNFSITPSIVSMALSQSGIEFAIPVEQHQALENLAFASPVVELRTTIKDGESFTQVFPTIRALCGIPYTIDRNLPPGTIELRLGNEVLVAIENLAVPMGMER